MLPAVLGVWLEVLLDGYWLELALLEVCGGVVLLELDGYCELDGFEVAVLLLMPGLVPAFELDVLGLVLLVALLWLCSDELDGLVLEELGYALELCGLLLVEDELEGSVVALELALDGLLLLVEIAVPDCDVADALVPAPDETVTLSFTLVTPGTDFAMSFAFLRSALEATEPFSVTTPFFAVACTPLNAGSAAN